MGRKLTQDEFINRVIEIHGDKYDYSMVNYVNNSTNVVIICGIHGEYLQSPANHIVGKGCNKCGNIKIGLKKTNNNDYFIKKSKEIHGDKYIYDKVEYKNNREKVIIICREHGEFLQSPHENLSGCGCYICGRISSSNKQSKTNEMFIIESTKKHGDKYDYSKVKYKNIEEKVIIICKIHGEYLQRPQDHLNNGGCAKCGGVCKYTRETFIEKSKEIHGDKYIYDKVEYKNNREKVIIICREHGEFLQTPSKHIYGQNCNKCSGHYTPTPEEFIEKCIKKHGNKYDYSQTIYTSNKEYINIICKIHGVFRQNANSHLLGCGCGKCSGNFTKTNKEFIENSKEIHGDKYDYSKVEYKNCKEYIIIICKIHGEFLQSPSNHKNGKGCIKCLKKYKNTEEFILFSKKIHNDKYDYSKVEYKNMNEKVIIICKIHGEFLQSPSNYTMGKGCSKCSGRYTLSNDEFIKKCINKHDDKYDYSKVEYKNCKENIIIICKKHGEFIQGGDSHLRGSGCPLCINKTEGKLYERIKKIYPSTITQFSPDWLGRKRYDFCIPEHKIIIELDGRQHFEIVERFKNDPEDQHENDKEKERMATENDYCLIRLLQEDVFYDTYDWFNILLENIQTLIDEKPTIQNIYMDLNDEYHLFL
jgi:very-short-patch-repair endonuclease